MGGVPNGADISAVGDGFSAVLLQFSGDTLGRRLSVVGLADVVHDQLGAAVREFERMLAAQPIASSGNDRYLSVEPVCLGGGHR